MKEFQRERFEYWLKTGKTRESKKLMLAEIRNDYNIMQQRVNNSGAEFNLQTGGIMVMFMADQVKATIISNIQRQFIILLNELDNLIANSNKVDAESHETLMDDLQKCLDLIEYSISEYRICSNEKSINDIEPIEDIPEDEFIRLSNGACWNIYNLIEYMQKTKGLNTSRDLPPNYPSKTVFGRWSSDKDLNRIFEHPKAKEQKLYEWYLERNLDEQTRLISDKTLMVIKEATELLSSQGPAFISGLRRELTKDEINALKKVNGVIANTGKYMESILAAINTILKSQASDMLLKYISKLSKQSLDALLYFRYDLLEIVTSCATGQGEGACVWYTADVLRETYNEIAKLKGLDTIGEGLAFSHVTPLVVHL